MMARPRDVRASRLLALVAPILTVGWPAVSGAQAPPVPPPTSAQVVEARTHFERGLKLYGEGLHREALAAFEHAKRISPRASIQRNIAQCHRDLKELPAAHDAYRELLDTYGSSMKPAEIADAQRALAELATLTGVVTVRLEPGAEIAIDDRRVGTTPLAAPVRLPVGEHRLVATKPGMLPIARAISIVGGDAVEVQGAFAAETTAGTVVVTGADPDADIVIDDRIVGRGTFEGELPEGPHRVEARGQGRSAPHQTIAIVRGQTARVSLSMSPDVGIVSVQAHPEAVIAIDGNVVGQGAFRGPLPVGRHELRVTAPGREPHLRSVIVVKDETITELVRAEDARPDVAQQPPEYEGVYVRLGFLGVFGPPPTSEVTTSCSEAASACDAEPMVGGGLTVRAGYSLGWIGFEGTVLGSYDTSSGSIEFAEDSGPQDGTLHGPARDEQFSFHQWGGGALLGARLQVPHELLRPTAGASFGGVYRGFTYERDAQQLRGPGFIAGKTPDETDAFFAPALLFDAGCTIGSTPGARFGLGVFLLLELPGEVVGAPADTDPWRQLAAPEVTVSDGVRFMVGPELTLHFGH